MSIEQKLAELPKNWFISEIHEIMNTPQHPLAIYTRTNEWFVQLRHEKGYVIVSSRGFSLQEALANAIVAASNADV
jgi:protein gp37